MSEIVLETSHNQGKLWGIHRKYVGAILGVFVFLSLFIASAFIKQLQLLNFGLTLPGVTIFVYIILPLKFPSEIVTIFHYLLIFGFSSIPAGFMGSLLISKNKSAGIRLLVIYCLYLLSVSVIAYIIVGGFNFYLYF